jgi:hypothetical protein
LITSPPAIYPGAFLPSPDIVMPGFLPGIYNFFKAAKRK